MPRLSYGVSKPVLALVWGPGASISFLTGNTLGWTYGVPFVLVTVLIHTIFRWFFKQDHRFFDIHQKYQRFTDEYQPDAREKLPLHFQRPAGWGRGLRI